MVEDTFLSCNQMVNQKNHLYIWLLLAFALFIGLLFSRFLLSISMFGILLFSLTRKNLKSAVTQFFKQPAFLLFVFIFILTALSLFQTENTAYLMERLRIRLPFLFLPFAIFVAPSFTKDTYFKILSTFVLLITMVSIGVFVNYLLHFQEFNELYGKGQVIPTPIHHIRFSLLMAVAIASTMYMILQDEFGFPFISKQIAITLAFLLIFILHFLAVRSGLLALYAILLFSVVFYIFHSKQWARAAVLFLALSIFGFIAATTIPTIKNKIAYTKYNIEQFHKNENIHHLSDSRRLGSLIAGISLVKEHPFFGVGVGDIRDNTNEYLLEHFPDIANLELMPHNQFLWYFSATGIIGGILFFLCTIGPLFYYEAYKDFLFGALQVIFISSYMVEHTLETQLGVACYIIFPLLSLRYLYEKKVTQ